nr:DUF3795 domain-containing protein [Enterocloster clostridioformis]
MEYTGESCCDIYECCINQRKYGHCGQCEELPCSHYMARQKQGKKIKPTTLCR